MAWAACNNRQTNSQPVHCTSKSPDLCTDVTRTTDSQAHRSAGWHLAPPHTNGSATVNIGYFLYVIILKYGFPQIYDVAPATALWRHKISMSGPMQHSLDPITLQVCSSSLSQRISPTAATSCISYAAAATPKQEESKHTPHATPRMCACLCVCAHQPCSYRDHTCDYGCTVAVLLGVNIRTATRRTHAAVTRQVTV